MDIIERYGLDPRQIAKDTGVDLITLTNLATFTPHLRTIERVSAYLQKVARGRRTSLVRQRLKRSSQRGADPQRVFS